MTQVAATTPAQLKNLDLQVNLLAEQELTAILTLPDKKQLSPAAATSDPSRVEGA